MGPVFLMQRLVILKELRWRFEQRPVCLIYFYLEWQNELNVHLFFVFFEFWKNERFKIQVVGIFWACLYSALALLAVHFMNTSTLNFVLVLPVERGSIGRVCSRTCMACDLPCNIINANIYMETILTRIFA